MWLLVLHSVLSLADIGSDPGAQPAPLGGESESTPIAEELRDGLRKQVLNNLETRGESISIMCVGESGLGKTSLLSSLFQSELIWPGEGGVQAAALAPTTSIKEISVPFDLDGVPFVARLIDAPGYGDGKDAARSFEMVTRFLDRRFRAMLRQESRIKRTLGSEAEEQPVDVVLYFFAPHRCKASDIQFLSRLKGKVSIVPILAKADTMTTDELVAFRAHVREAVQAAGVRSAIPPVPVICASRPGAGEPLGREYPWGIALSEGGESDHSELAQLRQFLLIDGLLDLKEVTREHYEVFRARALRSRQRVVGALQKLLPALLAALLLPQTRSFAVKRSAAATGKLLRFLPTFSLGVRSRTALEPSEVEPEPEPEPEREPEEAEPPAVVPPPPSRSSLFDAFFR